MNQNIKPGDSYLSTNVRVADITFSFNNGALIKALQARGTNIAYLQFDKAQQAEQKITELCKDFDSVTRPTAAFITFESDDATIAAKEYKGDEGAFPGTPFRCKQASEPTDIIWENRGHSTLAYFIRSIFAFTIIGALLAASFAFIYTVAKKSAEIAREFPKRDCDAIRETYGD